MLRANIKKSILILTIVLLFSTFAVLLHTSIAIVNTEDGWMIFSTNEEKICDENGEELYVISDVSLNKMIHLSTLKTSDLKNYSFLSKMKSLDSLTISISANNKESVNSLDTIPVLNNLDSLIINGYQFEIENFNSISTQMPNVSNIQLYGCSIQSFDSLSRLSNLESITVYGGQEELPDLMPLSDLSQLREIRLDGYYGSLNLQPLTDCSNLKTLKVAINDHVNLMEISKIVSLNSLYLEYNSNYSETKLNLNDLSFLSGMSQLEELTLHGFIITDGSNLLKIPELKKITIINCDIPSDVVQKLNNCGIDVEIR